jgi:hypothetical protein
LALQQRSSKLWHSRSKSSMAWKETAGWLIHHQIWRVETHISGPRRCWGEWWSIMSFCKSLILLWWMVCSSTNGRSSRLLYQSLLVPEFLFLETNNLKPEAAWGWLVDLVVPPSPPLHGLSSTPGVRCPAQLRCLGPSASWCPVAPKAAPPPGRHLAVKMAMLHMHGQIHMHMRRHVRRPIHIDIYIYIHIDIYIYTYIYIRVHIFTDICLSVKLYVYSVYIYIYIRTYIHIYTHTYVYIYTYTCRSIHISPFQLPSPRSILSVPAIEPGGGATLGRSTKLGGPMVGMAHNS